VAYYRVKSTWIYKTIILLVFFSTIVKLRRLTLREECRLSVFENRVLRRKFGPKTDEARRQWRKLHNDVYSLLNIIWVINSRRTRWAGHLEGKGERGDAYRVLVGIPEGKRSFGRPRRRWEDNIEMNLQDVGRGIDWIDMAQDRDRWRGLVNAVMNLRVQ
jgi:hypothetical protein